MKIITAVLLLCTLAVVAQAEDTADELWQRLQYTERQGPPPGATNDAERKGNILMFLGDVEKLCSQFIQQFPNDVRVWEARLDRLQVVLARADVNDQAPDPAVIEAGTKEILASSAATKPVKTQAGLMLLQLHAKSLTEKADPAKLAEFEKEYADFIAAHPNDPATRQLPFLRLDVYEKNAPTKAAELLKTLADDANPHVAMEAKRRLKAQDLKSKPLDLKFTDIDGKEFDIAKWRGKVVLVDFWATWCGPCRVEIPNLVGTYKKLHDKGFEIVGISLDSQKEKLLTFTKQNEMTWPQYFDGKGWGNTISTSFGIHGIPAMWLIDKKGFVRSTDARADLAGQVTKLLAE